MTQKNRDLEEEALNGLDNILSHSPSSWSVPTTTNTIRDAWGR